MHRSSYLRMEWFVENYLLDASLGEFKPISVLDIGSSDVNGCYRSLFPAPKFKYLGLDMAKGRNVDFVPKKPYDWNEIRSNSYDVIISGQCFEHVEFPWIIFAEICRILKEGGLTCIITPRMQGRHRYPVDTFRYDVDGMAALAKFGNLVPEHLSTNEAPLNASHEWFSDLGDCIMVARKPQNWPGMLDIKNYFFTPWPVNKYRSGFIAENDHPSMLRKCIDLLQDELISNNK